MTSEGAWGRHDCEGCPVDIWWVDEAQKKLSLRISDHGDSERAPIIITQTLSENDGDYRCENGQLVVEFAAIAENLLAGVSEFGEARFERGDDGSILLERRFDVFGHMLALPMVWDDVDYYRWAPFSRDLADIAGLPADQAISVVRKNVGKGRDTGRLNDKEFSTYRLQDNLDFADVTLRYGDIPETCSQLTDGWQLLNGGEPEISGTDRQAISDQIDQLTVALACESPTEPFPGMQ